MNEELKNKIDDTRGEIDRIKKWIDTNKFDSKIKCLNSYAVVKASGTIEIVFKNMLATKLTNKTSKEVTNYINKMILESSFNPSCGKISQLLQELNPEWRDCFDAYIKKNPQFKEHLNSLIGQRNIFAHGNEITTSIKSIKDYFESGVSILEEIESIIESI